MNAIIDAVLVSVTFGNAQVCVSGAAIATLLRNLFPVVQTLDVGNGQGRAVAVAKVVDGRAAASIRTLGMAGTFLRPFDIIRIAAVFANLRAGRAGTGIHTVGEVLRHVIDAVLLMSTPDVDALFLIIDIAIAADFLPNRRVAIFAAIRAVFPAGTSFHAFDTSIISLLVTNVFRVDLVSDAASNDSVRLHDASDAAFLKGFSIFLEQIAVGRWRALVKSARTAPRAFVMARTP